MIDKIGIRLNDVIQRLSRIGRLDLPCRIVREQRRNLSQ